MSISPKRFAQRLFSLKIHIMRMLCKNCDAIIWLTFRICYPPQMITSELCLPYKKLLVQLHNVINKGVFLLAELLNFHKIRQNYMNTSVDLFIYQKKNISLGIIHSIKNSFKQFENILVLHKVHFFIGTMVILFFLLRPKHRFSK